MVDQISESFEEFGFQQIKGLFTPGEIAELREEADRLFAMASEPQATPTGRLRWLMADTGQQEKLCRGVQFAPDISAPFHRLLNDPRLFEVMRARLGSKIKSVINTLFWKRPGDADTVISYHQDCSFRKPRENFRNLGRSYLQIGVAIDPHGPENGGMLFVPGSHKMGDLELSRDKSVLLEGPEATDLSQLGLAKPKEHALRMDAGDIVIWSPYLLHGSPANRSLHLNRRFFVAAYMRAEDCDAGDMVFEP